MQQITKQIRWLGWGSLVWIFFFIIGLCRPDVGNALTCRGGFINSIGEYAQLLLIFPLIFIVLSIILYFVQESFHLWFKFARIYLLIAFILIILAPATGAVGMGFSLGIDQESVTWTMAIFFLLISIILIIRERHKLRRSKQTNSPIPTD